MNWKKILLKLFILKITFIGIFALYFTSFHKKAPTTKTPVQKEEIAKKESQSEIPQTQQKKVPAKSLVRYLTPSGIIREGRELIGYHAGVFKDPQKKILFINTPFKEWKNELSKSLTRFSPDSQVEIQKIASLIQIESERKGRFIEYVQIKFKTKSKKPYGLLAIVDSSTGRIIDSWSHNIFSVIK